MSVFATMDTTPTAIIQVILKDLLFIIRIDSHRNKKNGDAKTYQNFEAKIPATVGK